MLHLRKTLINILSVAASDVVNRGFFFAFNIVVARNVPPEQFGYYALSMSIGVWLWGVVDGGLTSHGTKLVAQGVDPSELIGKIIGTRIVIFFLLSLIYGGLIFFLPVSIVEKAIYTSALLYTFAINLFPAWVARGQHDNIGYASSYMIVAIVGVLALFILIVNGFSFNAAEAIVARNGAWLIGAIIALIFIARRYSCKVVLATDFKILRHTIPLGGAAITYTLIPLMPFIAMRMCGWNEDLGQYGALWQIQQILLVGAGVLPIVLLPSYAKAISAGEEFVWKKVVADHFRIVTVVAFVVCVAYWLAGPGLVNIVYGDAYHGATMYLFPFVLALMFALFQSKKDF